MTAEYLVRLDDACPTMPGETWTAIERICAGAGVRPIVAVIPDNRDESLLIDAVDVGFWDRVRRWQASGWAIGLHGLHHRYVTDRRGRFGSHDASEFAGLPLEEQSSMIAEGLDVFEREGIRADVWVAPNHSFDAATVEALRRNGLTTISDGYALRPYLEDGIRWVPVQSWRFEARGTGVWTVCQHPNRWGASRLEAFERDVTMHRGGITDLASALERFGDRRRGLDDAWFSSRRRLNRAIGRRAARLRGRQPAES
jgi:predicted deacetylase